MTATQADRHPLQPPVIGPVLAPDLHVMTFNVRRPLQRLAWPRSDRWSVRAPRLAALLHDECPSILGAQEALPAQAEVIRDALGAGYRFVGHGRQRGRRGEGCPLFYDAERLQLLDWIQVPLSDHPDVAGSVSWGNVIPRVYVQATLRDRETSTEFTVLNTHLDAFSARARERAAQEIRRVVVDRSLPAMVLGDFNTGPDTSPLDALSADDELVDAWTAADERLTPEWGTYARYRAPREGRRIDWILTTPDVQVRRIAINARPVDGDWPSDHLPVHAVVRLPERSA